MNSDYFGIKSFNIVSGDGEIDITSTLCNNTSTCVGGWDASDEIDFDIIVTGSSWEGKFKVDGAASLGVSDDDHVPRLESCWGGVSNGFTSNVWGSSLDAAVLGIFDKSTITMNYNNNNLCIY